MAMSFRNAMAVRRAMFDLAIAKRGFSNRREFLEYIQDKYDWDGGYSMLNMFVAGRLTGSMVGTRSAKLREILLKELGDDIKEVL